MNRIKYRVWDSEEKKMLYNEVGSGFNEIPIYKTGFSYMLDTLMKDNDENDIYDGDILEIFFWDGVGMASSISLVVYEDGCFWKENLKISGAYSKERDIVILGEFANDYTVIGNKYESHELLIRKRGLIL